jgi:sulfoxide reductase heme-binding subunit YedZ
MSAALTSSFWYLSRGTGMVTLLLLTLVVALGIATRSGRPLPGLPRFAVAAVHRSASLLTLVFLGIHIGTLMFDKYAQLKLLDLVVPFGGTYRPLWLGLGTLASDLLLALVVTSLLRHRMGPKSWRAIHWTAYAAWPIALLHGLGTGTDSGQLWLRAAAALSTITVAAAIVWRMLESFGTRPPARPLPGYPGGGYPQGGYPGQGYNRHDGGPGRTYRTSTGDHQEASR